MDRDEIEGALRELSVELLLNKCHITSEAEALDLYDEFFPKDPLPPRAQPLLRSALSKMSS